MHMRNKPANLFMLCGLVALAVLLAACGRSALPSSPPVEGAIPTAPSGPDAYPPAATSAPPTLQEGYPAPSTPMPTSTAVSYPLATEAFQEPRFRIDQPVAAGATVITGQAPPNLSLVILDVTYNGALLGSGRSGDDGRFSIPVSGLVAGNRVGITFGELAEGQTLTQMSEQYFPYRGEGFMNLPNLGIFFDTAQVEP